jgi:hypothetical protein
LEIDMSAWEIGAAIWMVLIALFIGFMAGRR